MRAREGGESDQKNWDLYLFKRKKKPTTGVFTHSHRAIRIPLCRSLVPLSHHVCGAKTFSVCVCVFCNGNSVGLAALLPPIIIVALSPSCVRCTLTLSLTSVTTKESERRTISHTWWFCVFVCVCNKGLLRNYNNNEPLPPPLPKCVCVCECVFYYIDQPPSQFYVAPSVLKSLSGVCLISLSYLSLRCLCVELMNKLINHRENCILLPPLPSTTVCVCDRIRRIGGEGRRRRRFSHTVCAKSRCSA